MVFRVYSEKKPEFAAEAGLLLSDIKDFLAVDGIEKVRIINRYDAEGLNEELFIKSCSLVFSEPPVDKMFITLSEAEKNAAAAYFIYEALPGQYDQRADSAEQCIQLISQGERPKVKTAKVVMLYGSLKPGELEKIKAYVINPIDSRETDDALPEKLTETYAVPDKIEFAEGFKDCTDAELADYIENYRLSMDLNDIKMCRDYFAGENRDPSLTEIRILDTYWSDHCRHTTFNTALSDIDIQDDTVKKAFERYLKVKKELKSTKPVTLMDIATAAPKYLKYTGKLTKTDESEEINACTVKTRIKADGKDEDWLLLFKNETHNHPTEIEPFGGAATCIGGAIRDPLASRGYVYQAMRVTGAADPTRPIAQTLPGKLPQKKLVTSAAAGYSSYGNQIGLATGIVDEIYHDGYAAKHMEVGMVLGAVKEENVVRLTPQPGDKVILLGGRTGRDGCGGATGSSKSHDKTSLTMCGSEVQKGNAPEERKLQRLFRNPKAASMIIRCNDFGAGGVSVAIGELAPGLVIDLNKVPKKYEGLDSTELAISESQERMAVVVKPENEKRFIAMAASENLEATTVAEVSAEPRLTMYYNGKKAADISREFLDTNGAPKRASVKVKQASASAASGIAEGKSFVERIKAYASDLNICSKRALSERFDSTIGAASVLMPFGGKTQNSPTQIMAAKLPVSGETNACSAASWGYNPYITEENCYTGGYLAVLEALSKLVAGGCRLDEAYLTLQEYFEHLGTNACSWGKPFAALLGAFEAQLDYCVGAIGGKDSMSGSFENINVPPTLIAFGVAMNTAENIVSNEFKAASHDVVLITPEYTAGGLPEVKSQQNCFELVNRLTESDRAISVYTPTYGGAAEAIIKMGAGNRIGFAFDGGITESDIFDYRYGAFVCELSCPFDALKAENVNINMRLLGKTTQKYEISYKNDTVCGKELMSLYENRLESVYPLKPKEELKKADIDLALAEPAKFAAHCNTKTAKPVVLIPVFPGTNCEYDSAKAFNKAGAEAVIFPIRNLTAADVAASASEFAAALAKSNILFLPGGFSAGDEPEGSGKFITAFLRSPQIAEEITKLLEVRDGLVGGICNGFQALVKLGLVPYGKITDLTEDSPTLTFNTIGRHQSKLVRTKVITNSSPWLMHTKPGDIHTIAVSHGEGRFFADEKTVEALVKNGQIATLYCDINGTPSYDIEVNPNGSVCAIEGITSPDGRVFGKMAHSEREGYMLYKNVEGNKHQPIFSGAVDYFK